MKKINNKILFVSLIVILSVLLDQVTKMVAFIQKDKIGDGIKILDFFNIVYVENRGISFGIFSSLDASFYLGILSFLNFKSSVISFFTSFDARTLFSIISDMVFKIFSEFFICHLI